MSLFDEACTASGLQSIASEPGEASAKHSDAENSLPDEWPYVAAASVTLPEEGALEALHCDFQIKDQGWGNSDASFAAVVLSNGDGYKTHAMVGPRATHEWTPVTVDQTSAEDLGALLEDAEPGDTVELVAVSAPWGGFACNLKEATLSAGWREGGAEPDVEAYGPPDPTVQGAFAAMGPLRGKAGRDAASEGEVAWLEAFDAALAEVTADPEDGTASKKATYFRNTMNRRFKRGEEELLPEDNMSWLVEYDAAVCSATEPDPSVSGAFAMYGPMLGDKCREDTTVTEPQEQWIEAFEAALEEVGADPEELTSQKKARHIRGALERRHARGAELEEERMAWLVEFDTKDAELNPPDPTVNGAFQKAGDLRSVQAASVLTEPQGAWLEAFDAALAEVEADPEDATAQKKARFLTNKKARMEARDAEFPEEMAAWLEEYDSKAAATE